MDNKQDTVRTQSLSTSWVKNTALILFSVIFSISLAEIILRIAGISYPTFTKFDIHTGYSLLPGAEGWYTKEGHAYIRINSDGLRDREHAIKKPENTFRIAVLGDSYSEAKQVPIEKTFWHVLEQKLGSCEYFANINIEAINFGVSGYGTSQELLTLKHKAWKYDPDLVLLAIVPGNDIRNNSRELQGSSGRPYHIFKNNELVLDNSFMDKFSSKFYASAFGEIIYEIKTHSRIIQLLKRYKSHQKQEREEKQNDQQTKVKGNELGLDSNIYKKPPSPVWEEAWDITESVLRLINKETAIHGIPFFMVTISSGIQVIPKLEIRQRYMYTLGVDNLFYPDQRFEQIAQDMDIPFLKLAPYLLDWAETNNQCVHGFPNTTPCFGHWNEQGHHIAGQLIASEICKNISTRE